MGFSENKILDVCEEEIFPGRSISPINAFRGSVAYRYSFGCGEPDGLPYTIFTPTKRQWVKPGLALAIRVTTRT